MTPKQVGYCRQCSPDDEFNSKKDFRDSVVSPYAIRLASPELTVEDDEQSRATNTRSTIIRFIDDIFALIWQIVMISRLDCYL